MTDQRFAEWFDAELTRRGWNRAEMARRLDVWPSLITKWANGERIPRPDYCQAIAAAFGVDPDYVLYKAGHRELDIAQHGALRHEAAVFLSRIPEDLLPLAIPVLATLADPLQAQFYRDRLHVAFLAAPPARQPAQSAAS